MHCSMGRMMQYPLLHLDIADEFGAKCSIPTKGPTAPYTTLNLSGLYYMYRPSVRSNK
jgi:hypothetical protein